MAFFLDRSSDVNRLIVEVHPPSAAFSRGVLLVLAAHHALFTWGSWNTRSVGLWPLWPILFLGAAVFCVWAAIDFAGRWPTTVAAAATVTAFSSRALLVLLSWRYGSSNLGLGQTVMGSGVWTIAALLAAVVFTRGMAPLSASLRRED